MRVYAIAAMLALCGLCAFAFVPEPPAVRSDSIIGVDIDSDAQALRDQAISALENLRQLQRRRQLGTTTGSI